MLTCSFTYFNVGGCVGRRPCVAAWLSGGRDPDGAVQRGQIRVAGVQR